MRFEGSHQIMISKQLFRLMSASALLAASAFAGDIVDTAVSAGSFNTLVAAVKAAGLVDTLKGPGPFTVFAPTDEAFAKSARGTGNNLLTRTRRSSFRF